MEIIFKYFFLTKEFSFNFSLDFFVITLSSTKLWTMYDFRLKNACKKGMKRLNLGFSSKQPNLARYKYDFGGRPSNYIVNNNSVIWFNVLQKIKNKFCE